jgi:hypothetical protein
MRYVLSQMPYTHKEKKDVGMVDPLLVSRAVAKGKQAKHSHRTGAR